MKFYKICYNIRAPLYIPPSLESFKFDEVSDPLGSTRHYGLTPPERYYAPKWLGKPTVVDKLTSEFLQDTSAASSVPKIVVH